MHALSFTELRAYPHPFPHLHSGLRDAPVKAVTCNSSTARQVLEFIGVSELQHVCTSKHKGSIAQQGRFSHARSKQLRHGSYGCILRTTPSKQGAAHASE